VASPTTLTPPPELDQRLLEPRRYHWRGWLTALAILLTVLLLAGLSLSFVGMLPWRGPLSSSDQQPNGVIATFQVQAGDRIPYQLPRLANPSRVGVVLDSIDLVDPTPGVHIHDVWLFADTPRCRNQTPRFPYAVPVACRTPIAGFALAGHQDASVGSRVIVVLQPSQPGTYRSSGFDLHYHVGPIHYTTTYGDGFVIHAG